MLSISLVKGEAKLSDVKIDEIALMDMLKLPRFITLNSAICNEVFIKIPWTKLKSDPIHLAFDCVEVKISLDQGNDTSKNIVDSLMESANNMQNMNIDPTNPMSGSGGLIDKIIEGVKISINTLLVTVISYNFKAVIEITSVMIQSTSPSWKPAGLKFSRISMKELGTYIHFKEIQWSNMRVEVRIIRQNSESPLKIITNQTKLRVTTQKFLPGNVTNNLSPLTRVILIMEDLLWVINEYQISELIIFLSTCLLVSNDFQSRLTAKPYNPGALIAYNAAPFVVKTSEKYALFQRYQILEESMHLCIGKIDFHLCQNITNLPVLTDTSNLHNGNPKSLQVIIEKVGLDVYPRHYTHMSRDNWLDYNHGSPTTGLIPPKPYRWALNSLQSYWRDLELLLSMNAATTLAQGQVRKDPNGKPIPPPATSHSGNGDMDSRAFISTLINRAKSHLLQKCAVVRIFGDLRILDLSLYESNRDHGLIMELERARFHLPDGQPLIHVESNEYFYYNKLDFAHFLPVPNASLFVEANPLKVVAQYDSLAWLIVLASRVSTLWKMYYTDQCSPKLPRFHTDVHVECLMPRMVFPKYYFPPVKKVESAELNRCFALQCQASQITISNFTLIGDPPPHTKTLGQYDPRSYLGAPLEKCLKEIKDIKDTLRLEQSNNSFPETVDTPQCLNTHLFERFYPPSMGGDFGNIVADRRHFLAGPHDKVGNDESSQFSTVTARLPQTNISPNSCPGVCNYLCGQISRNQHQISPKCLWNLAWADRWICRLSYLVVEREEIFNPKHNEPRSNVLEMLLLGPLSCCLWLSPAPDPSGSKEGANSDLQPFKHVKGFEDITLQGQSYEHNPDLSKTSALDSVGHHKFYYQALVKITSPEPNSYLRRRRSSLAPQVDDGEVLVVRLDNAKYGSLLLLTESLSLMSERITELQSKIPPLLNPPPTAQDSDRNIPNGSNSRHESQTLLPNPTPGQIISVKMSFLIKLVVFKFYSNPSTTSVIPETTIHDPLSPPTPVNETIKDPPGLFLGVGENSASTKEDLGSDKLSDVISDTSDYLLDELLSFDSKAKGKSSIISKSNTLGSPSPLTPDRASLSSLASVRPQPKTLPLGEPRKSFAYDSNANNLVEIRARTSSFNARGSLIFPFLSHTTLHKQEDVLFCKREEIIESFTKKPKYSLNFPSKNEDPKPEIAQVEVGEDLLETPISVDHQTDDECPTTSHLKVSIAQEPTPFLTFALSSCLADIDIGQVAHELCSSLRPCAIPNCEDKVEVAFKLWARRGIIRDGAIVKMLNDHNKTINEDATDETNLGSAENCFLKFRATYSSKLDPHQQRYTPTATTTSNTTRVSLDQISRDLSTVIQVSVLPGSLDSGDPVQIAKLVPRAFAHTPPQGNHNSASPLNIIPLSPVSMEQFSELFTFSATQIPVSSVLDNSISSSHDSLKPVSPFTIFAHISQPIALTLLSTPTETTDLHPDNFDLLLRPLIAYRLATDGVLVLTNFADIIGEFFECYFDEMSPKSSTGLRKTSSFLEIDRLQKENFTLTQRIQELQLKLDQK